MCNSRLGATGDRYPGFKYMMNNEWANATSIWESWFFSDNTFSHNHPMYGSSEVWLVQSVRSGLIAHRAFFGRSVSNFLSLGHLTCG